MFLGHYGIAFAAKRAAPRTSLGALTFAAEFLDELWPILLLAGLEHVRIVPGLMAASPLEFTDYPYSHSLLMAVVWAAVIGGTYFVSRRYGRGACILALLVVSHWLLDVPMHAKDLPLTPGSNVKVGWGLWNSLPGTYAIELVVYAIGIAIYLRATRARDRIGSWGLWIYVLVLLACFLGANGSPPPSERALAWTTLLIWLFVPWAYWVDKHRYTVVRTATTAPSTPTR
jgi:membrane-bound metal-dependent hydrolase YbcI (DUF457 family)